MISKGFYLKLVGAEIVTFKLYGNKLPYGLKEQIFKKLYKPFIVYTQSIGLINYCFTILAILLLPLDATCR